MTSYGVARLGKAWQGTELKVTLYVRNDQFATYEKAKATLKDSISAVFMRCLERELAETEVTNGSETKTVVELLGEILKTVQSIDRKQQQG